MLDIVQRHYFRQETSAHARFLFPLCSVLGFVNEQCSHCQLSIISPLTHVQLCQLQVVLTKNMFLRIC
jgi:hypothetical protein